MKRDGQVRDVIGNTIKEKKLLSGAIVCTVLGAVLVSLVPPLILAQIVDRLTAGKDVTAVLMLLYFGMLALTGLLESVREGLLIVFGQKITHALRSRLMKKFGRLTTDNVNRQEPGTLVSRFVGDVDTVEKLFTSGIISMFADACQDCQYFGSDLVPELRTVVDSAAVAAGAVLVYQTDTEEDACRTDRESARRRKSIRVCAGDAAQYPNHSLPEKRNVYGRKIRSVYRSELSGDGADEFL